MRRPTCPLACGWILVVAACGNPSAAVPDGQQPDDNDATPGDAATDQEASSPFDPDACTPYAVHFLDGSAGQARRCTGVYYGGQTNLGQCSNSICYNELEVLLPMSFVKGHPIPAIVYIHGGGWANGSYGEANTPQEEEFLNRGFAVVSLNYRLSPQNTKGSGLDPNKSDPSFFVTMKSGRYDGPNPHATAVADVKTAIQYIRSNMADTIDGNNLVAMGHSAGAHLAVLLGVTGSSTNANADPNLRGRHGAWSTTVRAVIAKDPALDFGLFVGPKDQLPVCGELLTPANKTANVCGYSSHPAPPEPWDSTTLGTGLDDLCVDKNGPGNQYQFDTYGTNYFDESNEWSTTMMGGDPMVTNPTKAANYYQWLVTPSSYLDATSAPTYIINGVCDAEVPARGARDYGQGLGLGAGQLTVVLPQGGGHNDALRESINPGGNQAVRQWLSDNGIAIRVSP